MSASPITIAGAINPDKIDPMLAAIRQSLVDADASTPGTALHEFAAKNVVIIAPDETDAGIDAKIKAGIATKSGLCLLLIVGDGKNPDKAAPGPRMNLAMEAQLYVSSRIRGSSAKTVLELAGALMKFFHHAQIRISGFPWYEEIFVTGFGSLQDPDFTAYSITMEREFQL